jgi:hypothetical protein
VAQDVGPYLKPQNKKKKKKKKKTTQAELEIRKMILS